jgi:hypothetical protein
MRDEDDVASVGTRRSVTRDALNNVGEDLAGSKDEVADDDVILERRGENGLRHWRSSASAVR